MEDIKPPGYKGWKTKTAHQKNERYSSVQVKVCVYPNDVGPPF